MARRGAAAAPDAGGQQTTAGGGTDLRQHAQAIEGLLDDSGQFNPNPDQLSRGHPDYDPDNDPRTRAPDRDDKGRFKKSGAAASDDDEPTGYDDIDNEEDPDFDDAPDDLDSDDPDGIAADADSDAPDSDSDGEAPDDDGDAGETINTIGELAEALEMSLEDVLGSFTHSFKAAGEDVAPTLAELVQGFQLGADYRSDKGKLGEERRAFETEAQTRRQVFEEQSHNLATQMQLTEQFLINQLNDPRLASLRESDPAEWTARREEIGQHLGAIQQARQQAAVNYQTFTQNQMQEMKDREMQALQTARPDWGENDRLEARTTMESLGFSGEEIGQIFDHRLILGALEMSTLRAENKALKEQIAKAKDTAKRVTKEVPKMQKPGKQRQAGQQRGGDNVQRLRRRLAKSGKTEDAAAVIESMMN